MDQQTIILALEAFSSDSFLPLNKRLLCQLGPNTSIFLCNLIDKFKYFLSNQGQKEKPQLQEDGSFFLRFSDQSAQTGMSEYELRKCKKTLVEMGIISTYMKGIPPKEFYRIHWDILVEEYLRNYPLNFKGINPKNLKDKGFKNLRNIKDNVFKETKYKESSSSAEVEDLSQTESLNDPEQKETSIPKRTRTRNLPKEKQETSSIIDDKITPSQFDRFYNMYPKKVQKGTAKTAWDKLCKKKDRPTWREIKAAIRKQIPTKQWQNKKYIPNPSTWLNNSRWLDEPEAMGGYEDTKPQKSEYKVLSRDYSGYFAETEQKQLKEMEEWRKKQCQTN